MQDAEKKVVTPVPSGKRPRQFPASSRKTRRSFVGQGRLEKEMGNLSQSNGLKPTGLADACDPQVWSPLSQDTPSKEKNSTR